MKFRHVFTIFGMIIFAAIAPLAIKNAVAEVRLSRLPVYERIYNTESNKPNLDVYYYILVDGVEYYYCMNSNLAPLEVNPSPFGQTENKELLYWVDEPGGEWIYYESESSGTNSKQRSELASRQNRGHIYRRGDVAIPSPETVSVSDVGISSDLFQSPLETQQEVTSLLEGGQAQALAESPPKSKEDYFELVREGEFKFVLPSMDLNYEPLGSLQLHCEEYPGMVFVYQIYQGPEGEIFAGESEFMCYPLSEEYSALIMEHLTPSPQYRRPPIVPPQDTDPYQALYPDLPQYEIDTEQKTLLIDGVEYRQVMSFYKPIAKEEPPCSIPRKMMTNISFGWTNRPGIGLLPP